MRVSRRSIVPGLLAALALGACSSGAAGPGGLRRGLERAGLSAIEAACVVERVREELDPVVLDSRTDPSAAERATVVRILGACGVSRP